jgi:hypothetical protein
MLDCTPSLRVILRYDILNAQPRIALILCFCRGRDHGSCPQGFAKAN